MSSRLRACRRNQNTPVFACSGLSYVVLLTANGMMLQCLPLSPITISKIFIHIFLSKEERGEKEFNTGVNTFVFVDGEFPAC
jgi:hypothetical protein